MAIYDVLFPVRARVTEQFTEAEIYLAARVAFAQHPPDGCSVPEQELDMTWMDDLLEPGARMLRVTGDVTPPDSAPPGGGTRPDPAAGSAS